MKNYMAVAPDESFAFRLHQSTTTSSADAILLKAFARFIDFIDQLRSTSPEFRKAVENHANELLEFYCKGFSSRLLRTSKEKRGQLTVKALIYQFEGYAKKLQITDFDPLANRTIRLALYIDHNPLMRNLFLLFKKIYSKPIMN
jgi:hypothetical protein